MEDIITQQGKPFKITDLNREIRKGVVATSLEELTSKVLEKFQITKDVEGTRLTIVLETDGTEIDDDEYFATLDPNTNLMILIGDQKWLPPAPPCRLNIDQTDGGKVEPDLANLVGKLKHNLCHVSLLNGPDLEMLSDMDPDSLDDINFLDKIFLEQLKEASGRFLSEKRQAQDAIELLRLYQEKQMESGDAP